MSGMFCIPVFIMSYPIRALHSIRGTIYSIPIFSLVVLRKFCKYFLGITVKARRAAAFPSWYFKTALPEDRFDFTLHTGTRYYFLFHKHVLVVFLFYCFQQKKKCRILFSLYSFSDIVCVFA